MKKLNAENIYQIFFALRVCGDVIVDHLSSLKPFWKIPHNNFEAERSTFYPNLENYPLD